MKHALLPVVGLIGVVGGGACSGAKDQFGGDGGGGQVSCAVLAADSAMKDYGTISVGDPGPPVPITVTNTGSCPSAVLATAVAGQDADSFVRDTDACEGQTLQPGSSCMISTHFEPLSAGAKTATLTVAGGPGEAASVALTGTGAPITLLPTMQDYGTVVVGHKSVPTTFTLTNGGSAPTGMVKMDVLGGDQEQFIMQNDHCSGVALDPTKSCSVDVTFTAAGNTGTGNGEKTAKLTATIAGVATARSTLRGLVRGGPGFVVTPPMYDFGSVTAKTMTAPTSFVVKNTGQVASGVPSVAGSEPGCPHFTIANACNDGLPSMGSCRFTVLYAPPAPTTSPETCTLNVTAPQTFSGIAKVAGLGLTRAALQSNPLTHDFGNVLQGATSADFTFVITNTGMSTTTALGVSVSGSNASQFGLGPNTCADKQLNGMGTCSVPVHFSPNANSFGRVQAQLLVQASVGGIDSIGVSGTSSTPPSIAIGPDSNGFGAHEIGTASAAFRFTVTNSGSLPSGPPKVTLGGSGDFVKVGDSCNGTPIPGMDGSCTVDVIYRAAAHGFVTGTLTVSANPGGTVSATVNGTGVKPPALQITGPGDFGNVTVHTTSGTNTFTVRNNGETPSGGLQGAFINGANAGDFHITGDNCHGQQLGGNGANTCTVSVNFTPSNANFEQATLNENDGQGAGAGAGLRGTGICIPNCNNQGCGAGDGCGGQCGNGFCPNGQTCGGGGVKNVCGCTPNPHSCPANANCGTIDNGCGTMVSCGNTCTGAACVKNTCAVCQPNPHPCPANANCGTIDNGCGTMVSCGNTCTGAACVKNTCVCQPNPHPCPANANCGTFDNGCGTMVSCGNTCTGAACVKNTCAVCQPNPNPCPANANCGTFDNGCGTMVSCGNTCTGAACVKNTCAVCQPNPNPCPANANCGTIDNGCGTMVSCGNTCTGAACVKNTCAVCQPNPNPCPANANCGTIDNGCGTMVSCGNTCTGAACVKNTCAVCQPNPNPCPANANCGTIDNGCGTMVSCGNTCTGAACVKNTCAVCQPNPNPCPANANCGTIDNGCGTMVSCGNTCTGAACVKNTCAVCQPNPNPCPANANCGTIDNGCGTMVSCGNTCTGAACVKNTCAVCQPNPNPCPANANCGTIDNGCGTMVSCGNTCTGAACVKNTCAVCQPNPNPCPANANCGTIDNGCGTMVSCGNTCTGAACVKNTCACQPNPNPCPANANCGTIDNGCGTMVSCGNTCTGAACVKNTCVPAGNGG